MTELALETNLTDQQREYLQMVQNSAGALLETINSILDFSKIEAGKMELETIDFTLWETVTGALKPLAIMARNKRVELLYDEEVGVPERIRGDPGRLRQALINLVGNAVKFTDEGTVKLTVSRVESGEPGVRLRFEVVDTGIGVPKDKLGDIFESFQQVDGSMSRRFGGTGLGLAITSGLVGLMNGELVARSEEGVGSTFSFSALFGEADEERLPSPPDRLARGTAHPHGGRSRVEPRDPLGLREADGHGGHRGWLGRRRPAGPRRAAYRARQADTDRAPRLPQCPRWTASSWPSACAPIPATRIWSWSRSPPRVGRATGRAASGWGSHPIC